MVSSVIMPVLCASNGPIYTSTYIQTGEGWIEAGLSDTFLASPVFYASLQFRTSETEGLLMYIGSNVSSQFTSLELFQGELFFRSKLERGDRLYPSGKKNNQ